MTELTVKERGIIMSGESVRAILDGRKTQTRRVVKGHALEWLAPNMFTPEYVALPENDMCPYGKVGEHVWVRETWKFVDWTEDGYPFIGYAEDGTQSLRERFDESWSDRLADTWANLSEPSNYAIDGRAADRRWRSPIHMPRWASRITLEITGVRVERLQAVSEDDARAEGFDGENIVPARVRFRDAWDALNAARGYPWSASPWCWVLTFKPL